MVSNINKMLAFCFMFYFIASTFAKKNEIKLRACRNQMMNAYMLSERRVKTGNGTVVEYRIVPSWHKTIVGVLAPLCHYINKSNEENPIEEKDKGTKFILLDLLTTCEVARKYQQGSRDRQAYQNIVNLILPTCSVMNIYRDFRGNKLKITDYLPTCTFLIDYQSSTTKKYTGNIFTTNDFFPICNFAVEFDVQYRQDKEDTHDDPEQYCNTYSEEN